MITKKIRIIIMYFLKMITYITYIFFFCLQFGAKLPRKVFIHIYIKALTVNLNEKQLYKQLCDKNGSFESLNMLVQGYLKLANTLEDILSISRECILTAYCLMPSGDLLAKIENLAIKSGKLVKEHPTNVSEIVCNNMVSTMHNNPTVENSNKPKEDSYLKIHDDLSNLPDPLSPITIDNLIAVIKNPRYGPFNWNQEWSKMKMMCDKYLENVDTVVNRNMLIPSDLKYLKYLNK